MIRIKRKKTSPCEILVKEFIEPLGLTPKNLAEKLEIDVVLAEDIISSEHREYFDITAFDDLPAKLAKAFGTSVEFWINLQEDYCTWSKEEIAEAREEFFKAYGETPEQYIANHNDNCCSQHTSVHYMARFLEMP